jgi:hypothetical protein
MKKIILRNVHKADKSSIFTKQKKHCVFLGNQVNIYFSDLKKAKAYVVETNEFLNQKLFEVNALYIDVFSAYRKSWFYFFNVYDKNMHFSGNNQVVRELETIEKKMTLMVARSHFENGSFIIWQGFNVVLESLKTIIQALNLLYKQKKHYAEARQMQTIESRIKMIEDQLNQWGNDQINN